MRSNYLSHTSQFAHLTICSCDPVSVLGASRKFGDDGLWKSILAAGYPPKHRKIHTPRRWLEDLPPVMSWEEVLRRPKSRRAVQVSIFVCLGASQKFFDDSIKNRFWLQFSCQNIAQHTHQNNGARNCSYHWLGKNFHVGRSRGERNMSRFPSISGASRKFRDDSLRNRF